MQAACLHGPLQAAVRIASMSSLGIDGIDGIVPTLWARTKCQRHQAGFARA